MNPLTSWAKTVALGVLIVLWVATSIMAVTAKLDLGRAEKDLAASDSSLSSANSALSAASISASAEASAQSVLNETVAVLAKANRDRTIKIEQAVAANPDWASQPLPSDVIDSLRPPAKSGAESSIQP